GGETQRVRQETRLNPYFSLNGHPQVSCTSSPTAQAGGISIAGMVIVLYRSVQWRQNLVCHSGSLACQRTHSRQMTRSYAAISSTASVTWSGLLRRQAYSRRFRHHIRPLSRSSRQGDASSLAEVRPLKPGHLCNSTS